MTQVVFHFNVPSKLPYACRLLRKAVATGARVVVTGAAEQLQELDRLLWTFSDLDFVPHCLDTAAQALVQASPVVLRAPEALGAAPDAVAGEPRTVLVNLGQRLPQPFGRFEKLIELVSLQEADREQARQRWRDYADQGLTITRHDAATHDTAHQEA